MQAKYHRATRGTEVTAEAYAGWTLRCTDDGNTLLLIGTEVNGSCQSIDSSPENNQCLIAYVMDGKYRALTVTDAGGVTVARCMARVMLSQTKGSSRRATSATALMAGSRPVLLVENFYYAMSQNAVNEALKRVLHQFAAHVASLWCMQAVVRATEVSYPLSYQEQGDPLDMWTTPLVSLGRLVV